MKTIAFINNKGGVGKSSSVRTVAYHIAKNLGKRVLVVDIDPQGNTTLVFSETDLLDMLRRKEGLIPPGSDGLSVEDALTDASLDIRKCICPTIHDHLDLHLDNQRLYLSDTSRMPIPQPLILRIRGRNQAAGLPNFSRRRRPVKV